MSVEDRKKLTAEEAYELVQKYVKALWFQYKDSLAHTDPEDAIQDIIHKILVKERNPDYNPEWKPGEVIHRKRASGADYKDVDTSYMLKDGYNPDEPYYDPLPHLMKSPEYNYLDKYNGRTTSKAYYIMNIVKMSLIDMAKKKDPMKYADSLDRPIDNDGDSTTTLGDTVSDGDERDEVISDMERSKLRSIIMKMINMLPNETIDDKGGSKGNRGAVGWSPLTGQTDASGNRIENFFSLRDAAMHLLYGYTADRVAQFYHRGDGTPIAASSVSAKYSEVKKRLKDVVSALPSEDIEFLKSIGFTSIK